MIGAQLVVELALNEARRLGRADETIVLHPSGSARDYPAGSPLASSAVLTQEWTETTPATR